MLNKDAIQDINMITANMAQDQQLAYHKKHIQVLWNHLERLEQFIKTQGDGSIRIEVGMASITLKKSGDIDIKGNFITINGSGKVSIQASSDVVLKGNRILQN